MLATAKKTRSTRTTGTQRAAKAAPASKVSPVDVIINEIADIRALSQTAQRQGDVLPDAIVTSRVGTAIRMLRTYKAMSQAQLAKHLSLTQGQLSNIELAKSTPDVCLLYRAAKAFEIGVADLLRLADVN